MEGLTEMNGGGESWRRGGFEENQIKQELENRNEQ